MTTWTAAFRRSEDLGPAVFTVTASYEQAVRGWAASQDVAAASRREVHSPSVDAWAVLDGGVTAVEGYGLTSLPGGVRVIGFGAFRLLLAEFALAGPVVPFDRETPLAADELRRRHRGTPRDAAAQEQAELLAECSDTVMLRWVATTLLAG